MAIRKMTDSSKKRCVGGLFGHKVPAEVGSPARSQIELTIPCQTVMTPTSNLRSVLEFAKSMNTQQLISVSVTPVVLISACGLVTLALYNRLSAILARIRSFHQQKIELLENRQQRSTDDRQMLMCLIDSQIAKVMAKATMIQKGLFFLLSAVLAFLFCSLLAAVAVLHETVGVIALATHLIGLVLFAGGIGWALRELVLSLSPLEEESNFLASLTIQRQAQSEPDRQIGLAKAA